MRLLRVGRGWNLEQLGWGWPWSRGRTYILWKLDRRNKNRQSVEKFTDQREEVG